MSSAASSVSTTIPANSEYFRSRKLARFFDSTVSPVLRLKCLYEILHSQPPSIEQLQLFYDTNYSPIYTLFLDSFHSNGFSLSDAQEFLSYFSMYLDSIKGKIQLKWQIRSIGTLINDLIKYENESSIRYYGLKLLIKFYLFSSTAAATTTTANSSTAANNSTGSAVSTTNNWNPSVLIPCWVDWCDFQHRKETAVAPVLTQYFADCPLAGRWAVGFAVTSATQNPRPNQLKILLDTIAQSDSQSFEQLFNILCTGLFPFLYGIDPKLYSNTATAAFSSSSFPLPRIPQSSSNGPPSDIQLIILNFISSLFPHYDSMLRNNRLFFTAVLAIGRISFSLSEMPALRSQLGIPLIQLMQFFARTLQISPSSDLAEWLIDYSFPFLHFFISSTSVSATLTDSLLALLSHCSRANLSLQHRLSASLSIISACNSMFNDSSPATNPLLKAALLISMEAIAPLDLMQLEREKAGFTESMLYSFLLSDHYNQLRQAISHWSGNSLAVSAWADRLDRMTVSLTRCLGSINLKEVNSIQFSCVFPAWLRFLDLLGSPALKCDSAVGIHLDAIINSMLQWISLADKAIAGRREKLQRSQEPQSNALPPMPEIPRSTLPSAMSLSRIFCPALFRSSNWSLQSPAPAGSDSPQPRLWPNSSLISFQPAGSGQFDRTAAFSALCLLFTTRTNELPEPLLVAAFLSLLRTALSLPASGRDFHFAAIANCRSLFFFDFPFDSFSGDFLALIESILLHRVSCPLPPILLAKILDILSCSLYRFQSSERFVPILARFLKSSCQANLPSSESGLRPLPLNESNRIAAVRFAGRFIISELRFSPDSSSFLEIFELLFSHLNYFIDSPNVSIAALESLNELILLNSPNSDCPNLLSKFQLNQYKDRCHNYNGSKYLFSSNSNNSDSSSNSNSNSTSDTNWPVNLAQLTLIELSLIVDRSLAALRPLIRNAIESRQYSQLSTQFDLQIKFVSLLLTSLTEFSLNYSALFDFSTLSRVLRAFLFHSIHESFQFRSEFVQFAKQFSSTAASSASSNSHSSSSGNSVPIRLAIGVSNLILESAVLPTEFLIDLEDSSAIALRLLISRLNHFPIDSSGSADQFCSIAEEPGLDEESDQTNNNNKIATDESNNNNNNSPSPSLFFLIGRSTLLSACHRNGATYIILRDLTGKYCWNLYSIDSISPEFSYLAKENMEKQWKTNLWHEILKKKQKDKRLSGSTRANSLPQAKFNQFLLNNNNKSSEKTATDDNSMNSNNSANSHQLNSNFPTHNNLSFSRWVDQFQDLQSNQRLEQLKPVNVIESLGLSESTLLINQADEKNNNNKEFNNTNSMLSSSPHPPTLSDPALFHRVDSSSSQFVGSCNSDSSDLALQLVDFSSLEIIDSYAKAAEPENKTKSINFNSNSNNNNNNNQRKIPIPIHSSPNSLLSISPFDLSRNFLVRLFNVLSGGINSNIVGLTSTAKFRRSVRLFDSTPARECHKIGLIYVGPDQDNQNSILQNSSGSTQYRQFLPKLGWPVKLSSHRGFMGGLDPATCGSHSIYWSSATVEVMFHVVSLMPTRAVASDEQQIHKKKQVGNDAVQIVFSEFYRDYRPSTVTSDFNHAHIVIYPLESKLKFHGFPLFRVAIHSKPDVPPFGPLQNDSIIPLPLLAPLVRSTAINANRAIRHSTAGLGRPLPNRKKYLDEAISKAEKIPFEIAMKELFRS